MPAAESCKRGSLREVSRDTAEALLALKVPRHTAMMMINNHHRHEESKEKETIEEEEELRQMPSPAPRPHLVTPQQHSRPLAHGSSCTPNHDHHHQKERPVVVYRSPVDKYNHLKFVMPGRPMPAPPKLPKTVVLTTTHQRTVAGDLPR
jgi:hypothetical protein